MGGIIYINLTSVDTIKEAFMMIIQKFEGYSKLPFRRTQSLRKMNDSEMFYNINTLTSSN